MSVVTIPELPGLLPVTSLLASERDEMFELLDRHFAGVTRDQFEQDLAEKNWVITLRQRGRLAGFSTLLATSSTFEGQSLTALYSGDTIVAPEARGTPELSRTWIAAVNHLRGEFPARPCYWLLLTSGFRTYRFLPVFWREFYPGFATRPSPFHQRLLLHLARERYQRAFDAAAGLVRFPHPQRLRGALAEIPPGRLADPHIAFFWLTIRDMPQATSSSVSRKSPMPT